jgi:hypothetical protein
MVPEKTAGCLSTGEQKMNIRRLRFLSILLALIPGTQALGQDTDSGATAEFGLNDARALLQVGRIEIIKDEMRFTEEEAAAFWPAYDDYQSDLTEVRNRYADLLTTYSDAYRAGTVSEAFAEQMVDDFLDIQEDLIMIKKKHLDAFRKALPARKVTRFYQLENKIDAGLEAQLALVVPLIDPV